ncbi:MAG: hypothetical protein AAFN12_01720 [Cyanobacteria bacterium J06560_2]
MKLTELKAAVYKLAKVSTTKQLKAQNKVIKTLDLRYKASWEKALAQLRDATPQKAEESASKALEESNPSGGFEAWVSNPLGEFGELFAEADAALGSFDEKLAKTKQLTQRAIAMTQSLDEFAEASLDEAKRLAKTVKRTIDTGKEADLN